MRTLWMMSALLIGAGLGYAEGEEAKVKILEEDWMKVMLQGNQIGHMHQVVTEETSGSGKVFRSRIVQQLSLKRMGTTLTIREETEEVEDPSGKVLEFISKKQQGPQTMEASGKLEGEEMVVQSGGKILKFPYPKGAIGSYRFAKMVKESGLEPGAMTKATGFDKNNPPKPFDMVYTLMGEIEKDVAGQPMKLFQGVTEMSHMPGLKTESWMTREFRVKAMAVPLGGLGKMEFVTVSKELALQQVDPRELFLASFMKSNMSSKVELKNPKTLKRAKYRMSPKDPESRPNLMLTRGAEQSVTMNEDGSADIEVRRLEEPAADQVFTELPVKQEGVSEYLKPTPYLQSDDPGVVKLAQQIQGNETNALLLAKRIEKAILMKIKKKNLSKGFDSAAQVAKTMEGDCTEHAVLCAAIARSMGLPSRVVSGLVGVPEGFAGVGRRDKAQLWGYHMWTEVLVAPDVWWPVDAAVDGFDVTHISILKTGLDQLNPQQQLGVPLMNMVGLVDLDVLEAE